MNVATPEGQTVFISAGGKKKEEEEERVPDPIPPMYNIAKAIKPPQEPVWACLKSDSHRN